MLRRRHIAPSQAACPAWRWRTSGLIVPHAIILFRENQKLSATAKTAEHVRSLTSVRFFAALYVVLYHGNPFEHGTFLWRFFGLGYVSVSFFFMLSGFILGKVYFASGRHMQPGKFFVSRLARIYPLYFAALLLDLPHYAWTSHVTWTHVGLTTAITALLMQGWFPHFRGINDPGWSLSAEAFFYLLFPAIGGMLWRLRTQAAAVCGVALYLAGLLVVHYAEPANHFSYNPAPHLYVFLLGVLLARVLRWFEEEETRTFSLGRAAPILVAVTFFAFLVIPILSLPIPESLLQQGLLAPLFAVAILALSSNSRLLDRLFGHAWLVLLGEASYALYLLHVPLGYIFRKFVRVQGLNAGFFLYLALAVTLSVLSFLYFEKPARRWILANASVRSKETILVSSIAQ